MDQLQEWRYAEGSPDAGALRVNRKKRAGTLLQLGHKDCPYTCIAGTTRAQRGYNWGEIGIFSGESGVYSLVRCGPKRL